MPNLEYKYFCNLCDFKCCKLSNYNIHCLTRKHIKVTQCDTDKMPEENTNSEKVYNCDTCSKIYKSRNGLWMHKKQCVKEPNKNKNDNTILLEELLQQTTELKNVLEKLTLIQEI